jgi:hypothetical protein
VNVTDPGGQTLVIFAARAGVVEDWFIAIGMLLLVGGLLALSHVPPSAFTEKEVAAEIFEIVKLLLAIVGCVKSFVPPAYTCH